MWINKFRVKSILNDNMDQLKEDLEWLYRSVDYVAHEYASQECSECRYVDKENRKGKVFKCKYCGYMEGVDINDAKNIRKYLWMMSYVK